MRIVHFTNNDYDGAGRAVLQLNRGLRELGVDSDVMVLYRKTAYEHVHIIGDGTSIRDKIVALTKRPLSQKPCNIYKMAQFFWNILLRIWSRFYWRPRSLFNFKQFSVEFEKIESHVLTADVIMLHSIQDMLSLENIERIYNDLSIPIIFRPLDMEPMTGGCHFNYNCNKYISSCGNCPQLGRDIEFDITRKQILEKKKYFQKLPINLIATNNFVKNRLESSSIFGDHSVTTIFLGIESQRYGYIEQHEARRKLQLSTDERIILFGCLNFNDKRKGAYLLKDAIKEYLVLAAKSSTNIQPLRLVTFGSLQGVSFNDLSIK